MKTEINCGSNKLPRWKSNIKVFNGIYSKALCAIFCDLRLSMLHKKWSAVYLFCRKALFALFHLYLSKFSRIELLKTFSIASWGPFKILKRFGDMLGSEFECRNRIWERINIWSEKSGSWLSLELGAKNFARYFGCARIFEVWTPVWTAVCKQQGFPVRVITFD